MVYVKDPCPPSIPLKLFYQAMSAFVLSAITYTASNVAFSVSLICPSPIPGRTPLSMVDCHSLFPAYTSIECASASHPYVLGVCEPVPFIGSRGVVPCTCNNASDPRSTFDAQCMVIQPDAGVTSLALHAYCAVPVRARANLIGTTLVSLSFILCFIFGLLVSELRENIWRTRNWYKGKRDLYIADSLYFPALRKHYPARVLSAAVGITSCLLMVVGIVMLGEGVNGFVGERAVSTGTMGERALVLLGIATNMCGNCLVPPPSNADSLPLVALSLCGSILMSAILLLCFLAVLPFLHLQRFLSRTRIFGDWSLVQSQGIRRSHFSIIEAGLKAFEDEYLDRIKHRAIKDGMFKFDITAVCTRVIDTLAVLPAARGHLVFNKNTVIEVKTEVRLSFGFLFLLVCTAHPEEADGKFGKIGTAQLRDILAIMLKNSSLADKIQTRTLENIEDRELEFDFQAERATRKEGL